MCKSLIFLLEQVKKFHIQSDESERQEDVILCVNQIATCVHQLQKTISVEKTCISTLNGIRKYFLDRIHWSLDRLNLITSSNETGDISDKINPNINFVNCMDIAMDLINPLTMFPAVEATCNDSNDVDDDELVSNLRAVVNALIGHTLSFSSVALSTDQTPLNVLCRMVNNNSHNVIGMHN